MLPSAAVAASVAAQELVGSRSLKRPESCRRVPAGSRCIEDKDDVMLQLQELIIYWNANRK